MAATSIVADRIAALLPRLRDARQLFVAYSGGLDSTVLLHATAGVLPAGLTAIHVNHGLSPASDHWQVHCEQFCAALDIRLVSRTISVDREKKGLEAAARHFRYRVFREVLETGDLLLQAHHLDDQVETVMYRLLRGSGPAGLAGIPEQRPLGRGTLLRPFLDLQRSELETYAREQGLDWIDDESNDDPAFDRNYLRHRVMPSLAVRWPHYRQRIARSAAQCRRAEAALAELADEDLAATGERDAVPGRSLSIDAFNGLSVSRRINLLKHWPQRHGRGAVGHRVIDEVLTALLPARRDAAPVVRWEGGELRRFRGRLYLLPPLERDFSVDVALELSGGNGQVKLPNGVVLDIREGEGREALAVEPGDRLAIKTRRGGEYCRPASRAGGASLKKLLNEFGLEPWLRDSLPLIYRNGELAAAAGLFVCRDHCCRDGERGLVIQWRLESE